MFRGRDRTLFCPYRILRHPYRRGLHFLRQLTLWDQLDGLLVLLANAPQHTQADQRQQRQGIVGDFPEMLVAFFQRIQQSYRRAAGANGWRMGSGRG